MELFGHLFKGVLNVDLLFAQHPRDFLHQSLIFENEKVRVEN